MRGWDVWVGGHILRIGGRHKGRVGRVDTERRHLLFVALDLFCPVTRLSIAMSSFSPLPYFSLWKAQQPLI